MIQFDAEQGTGIIFPSWLQHWVPPTQFDRVSVSWNIIPLEVIMVQVWNISMLISKKMKSTSYLKMLNLQLPQS